MITSFAWHARTQRALSSLMRRLGRDRFSRDDFLVTPLTVQIPDLAAAFDGYRIVQISDIHFGHWVSPDRLFGIVELINDQKPDLVVNTGDFVSYVMEELAPDLMAAMGQIEATDGSLAVLGNHDHWMGANRVTEVLSAGNVTVLRNDVFSIKRSTAELHVGGVDDIIAEADRLEIVMDKLPPTGPAMMLAHEPDFADETAATGRFFLQLSGHSHGTQLVPPILGPVIRGRQFQKYPSGLYQIGDMLQYTSNGVGTHALRLRINCPPEIVVVTLRSTSPSPTINDQ
jgi:predicted MPP superfamily phosphohydrolase